MGIDGDFEAQFERFCQAAGVRGVRELAIFLVLGQAEVEEAIRQNKIPAEWLIFLFSRKGIDPDWVRTGRGERLVKDLPTGNARYLDGYEAKDRREKILALQSFSARELAEELLKRIRNAGL